MTDTKERPILFSAPMIRALLYCRRREDGQGDAPGAHTVRT